MKLIRTLIDSKSTPDAPAQRPKGVVSKPRSERLTTAMRIVKASDQALIESVSEHMPALHELKSDDGSATPSKAAKAQEPKAVWELETDFEAEVPAPVEDAPSTAKEMVETMPIKEPEKYFEVPDPLTPRKPRQAGRVKTRIMGFASSSSPEEDLFDRLCEEDTGNSMPLPVGWLVVTDGPGRGQFFALRHLVSTIGRGEDQTITLDFGDDTISRKQHAAVAFDDQLNSCFIGYGGKANLVRLNGRPVLSTEQLKNGDTIRVGETDLRFVALCGDDFTWADAPQKQDRYGSQT